MDKKLMELVTGEQVVTWLVIAFLVGYFIYKEWPEFKRRITSGAVKEQKDQQADRTVEARLDNIEKDIREIKEKLNRDYDRINDVSKKQRRYQAMLEDSLEERGIIMEALLGALGGLQELGANGPTKEAKDKIQNYLNRKAHENDEQ